MGRAPPAAALRCAITVRMAYFADRGPALGRRRWDNDRMRRAAVIALVALSSLIVCAGGGAKPRPGVTLAAVGDTMLGSSPELPADPGSYLDAVEGQLRGDVVFGNLEGTLTDITS